MANDIVQRLQSAKRWIDKAEQAFSLQKTVSGEISLIMAQAEMQRLKETKKAAIPGQKWLMRGGVLAVALCVAVGISSSFHYFTERQSSNPATSVSVPVLRMQTAEVSPSVSVGSRVSVSTEVPANKPVIVSESGTETRSVSIQAEPVPDPAPVQKITPVVPSMSQQEIQSVVGEAGRALRGQP